MYRVYLRTGRLVTDVFVHDGGRLFSTRPKLSGPFLTSCGSEYVVLGTGEKLYRPEEPGMEDCCGKGCTECVWTVFWEARKRYDSLVADVQGLPRQLSALELLELKLEKEKKKNS